jgi:serpin B
MKAELICILTALLLVSVASIAGCLGGDEDDEDEEEKENGDGEDGGDGTDGEDGTDGTDGGDGEDGTDGGDGEDGTDGEDGEDGGDGPTETSSFTKGVNEYVDSNNEFTFDMYGQLKDADSNVFFSPYSITTALGMAYEGARGDTATEMEDVLNFPSDDEERLNMMLELQSGLNPGDVAYQLSTANAYWLREDGELKEEYRTAIEDYYLAHGELLDFAGDPAGSVDTINTWVEDRTEDRIKDLLSEFDVGPDTFLVLTNAIYFKSDWKYQFDPEATQKEFFFKAGGGDSTVDMMHMSDETIDLNYAGDDDAQLLQLPYKDGELSMFILLPRGDDIASLEAKLDGEYVGGLMDDMSGEWVDVSLPKFKFEQKYLLNKPLIDMGMPTAFGGGADFSGIADRDLFISLVIHQSFVEVNEEGTEAAAATAVVMDESASPEPGPEPVVFRADHPFIFFIQHEETGQILFTGKVGDPSA